MSVAPLSFEQLKECLNKFVKSNFVHPYFEEEISLLADYIKLYPTMSERNIWLYMDRHDKADDNAEHLFRYSAAINDGVERYFVVSKNSPDKKRLKKYGNVVDYGSREHKLLALFAKKYITSNFDFLRQYPFGEKDKIEMFQGLVKSQFIFLQHGITKDDMSQYFDRLIKNFKLLITANPNEYKSIIDTESYGYTEEQVKLTGFARYDNLYDSRKKQIVFMPTWRNTLLSTSELNYQYNEAFKYTDYFKVLSEFINDAKLIEAAKEYGYELVFRPHPNVYAQVEDFKLDDSIMLSPFETSYQKIFADASLIITDYSSAIFDYAYLKKPVLYYHFDEGQYDKGYFDYETMGFGEIAKTKDDLISLVIEYMKSSCKMKDRYINRVDKFFTYKDANNCKRIHDEISKL